MKKIETLFEIKVEFYDLDPMNVVWHGNYVKYIEAARCDFFEKIACTYMDMKDAGFVYPVAKMEMKYINPCTFSQTLVIKTILEQLEPSLNFKYIIYDKKTNEKLFSAKTMQICIDIDTRKTLYNAPAILLEKIKNYEN